MYRYFCAVLFVVLPTAAQADGYVMCFRGFGPVTCISTNNLPNANLAQAKLFSDCRQKFGPTGCSSHILERGFSNDCVAIYYDSIGNGTFFDDDPSLARARANAARYCGLDHDYNNCKEIHTVCDGVADPFNQLPQPNTAVLNPSNTQPSPSPSRAEPPARRPLVAQSTPQPTSMSFLQQTGLDRLLFGEIIGSAAIVLIGAGIAFLVFIAARRPSPTQPFFKQGRALDLTTGAKQIEVLVVRSQRMNWLNRVIFMIDAQMGVGAEQLDLISKYRLGKTIVFDSARRERQNELARTHLESAREKSTRTICLWREEVRGFFRRLGLLLRALISFLLGFLFIRITLTKLIRGTHVESKSLDKILAAKNAIERGAADLKAYLEVAETFDGREDLFEPS
jgi:hypothetical protein